MIKNILLPNLGEGVETAEVSEVLVKPGDQVAEDTPILVLESEKATMEIPAEMAGTIKEIFVENGEQISTGQKLMSIEISDADKSEKKIVPKPEIEKGKEKKEEPKPVEKKSEAAPKPAQTVKESSAAAFASPSVRRFARELGADLSLINGTGTKGRILKEDVQGFIKAQLTGRPVANVAQQPEIDFSQWGEIETVSLNKIRRITGERMTAAWQTVPQVTNFDKVDITELETMRRTMQKANGSDSAKITLLPFIMKACVNALKEPPDVNSSLSTNGQELINKKYYHIRIAVDTSEGLMVPVIRDVDKKNVFEISQDLAVVSKKARDKKLMPDDLAGGTFTISSLGGIGGTYFTPIVNPPEVAILGVSRAKMEPLHDGSDFVPKLLLPLTLSYDHRVIDGALAARFMKFLNEQLSDVKNMSDTKIF